MSFFKELKRRNVFKVAIAYIVLAWLVMQVADVILNNMDVPGWVFRVILLLLGIGFVLAIFFAWAFELTPDGLRREQEVEHPEPGTDEVSVEEPSTEAEKSIAVLPFPDMSAERDQEHFCDGLTEELLNVFTSIPDLRVASRTSCFAFKGKDVSIPDIAAQLDVSHVLEGSVRKAGNDVRITAQLIEVATDSHLWSEAYNRSLENVFEIQEEISVAIANELQVTLGTGQARNRPTDNIQAYQEFLRGRHLYQDRGGEQLDQAIVILKNVVATEPDYADAWANLAGASVVRSFQMKPASEYVSKSISGRQVASPQPASICWPLSRFMIPPVKVWPPGTAAAGCCC